MDMTDKPLASLFPEDRTHPPFHPDLALSGLGNENDIMRGPRRIARETKTRNCALQRDTSRLCEVTLHLFF